MLTKKANLLKVINNIYFKKKEPVSLVHLLLIDVMQDVHFVLLILMILILSRENYPWMRLIN